MTDNEKLQLWQVGMLGNPEELQIAYNTPDYLNDDAAAMSLLDTLVEKGYEPTLQYHKEMGWWIDITKEIGYWANNRREAIISAVLEVAKRELGADEAARLEVARKEMEE